jgi:hypothetical protein
MEIQHLWLKFQKNFKAEISAQLMKRKINTKTRNAVALSIENTLMLSLMNNAKKEILA